MEDKLLHKWLNDSLTEAERTEFEARPDFEFHKQLLEDALAFKAEQFSVPPEFSAFKKTLPSQQTDKLRYLRPLWKVAAVLVVALGLYFTLFDNGKTRVETAFTEQKAVRLPDASEVLLNADTQISFDSKNWEEARAVSLRGEAYFKVAKGKLFDVITPAGKVSVLGTQFSVVQRKDFFQVICYEGRVVVNFGDALTELTPGEAIRLLEGKASEFSIPDREPAWLNKKSVFKDVPLKIVLDELERQYNIKVNAKIAIQNRSFNGAFTHEDLENALLQITAPLQLEFNINGREVILSEKNP